jgi:uncharacterized protein (TIGR00730 family)
MTTNHFTRICVYCGASQGARPEYIEAAQALGAELARRSIGLIYGGGSVGMMGTIARSVHEGGGSVYGVIPQPLTPKELSGAPIGELEIVDTMHTRKARMAELADGFIAMPGGFGTLEELFETITWSQLGIHAKPIGLLNVAGYYDPLCQMIKLAIAEGFIRPAYTDLLVVSPEPIDLLDRLANHQPPRSIVQWVTAGQT